MNLTDSFISSYGIQMPRIIYGTAWKKERTADLVKQAIEHGFRGIDTACQPKHYNESGVGEGLSAILNSKVNRSTLYLQTKFTPLDGQDITHIPYDPAACLSIQVSQSFQKSLENLKTTYLDGLILHAPLKTPAELMEVWQTMESIFHDGGAKQLGISNCYDIHVLKYLYQSAEVKPAVIQNRFYEQTQYDRMIREFCREYQIIYQSFWTLTANPHVLAHSTVQHLVKKYRRSAAQVFFRYLTQIRIIPLTGTTSTNHMQADLEIFDFLLADDDCEAISKLL